MAGIVVYKPTRDLYNAVVSIMGGQGSGIAAQKTGYHDSRNNNPRYNYSVVLPLDKQGPGDGAAALDITLSDAKMKKWTKKLMAGLKAKDPRLKAIKEVIGTTNGYSVIRYTRNSPTSNPINASSDSSHLWHIHISLFRAFINNWSVLQGIVDFLTDRERNERGEMLPEYGDKDNTTTGSYQFALQKLGFYKGKVDNDYGPGTQASVTAWHKAYLKRRGSKATPTNGKVITPAISREIDADFFAWKLGVKVVR